MPASVACARGRLVVEEKTAQAAKTRVAYVFPGQGSQGRGMGYELYRSSAAARAVFDEADTVLGFPLSRLCFEGPDAELGLTINSQPAILTVSLACLRAAAEAGRWQGASMPDFVAGHSLGEYTALVVANVLDLAEAIRLVRERGRLMQEAGERQPGGMAAIMGLDEASLEEVCQEAGTQIANINCSGQIVISGAHEALVRAMDLCRVRGARRTIPLQVSGAFHSPLMRPALEGMTEIVSTLGLRRPAVPIVANTTAQPITDAEAVKAELLGQLCGCVQWQRSIEYMVAAGVSTFVEIGPGQVLTGLIRRIDKDVQTVNIGDVPTDGDTSD